MRRSACSSRATSSRRRRARGRGPGPKTGWRLASPPVIAMLVCALVSSRRQLRLVKIELSRLESELDALSGPSAPPTTPSRTAAGSSSEPPALHPDAAAIAVAPADLASEWEAAAAPMDS